MTSGSLRLGSTPTLLVGVFALLYCVETPADDGSQIARSPDVRVMSFNIRYANPGDGRNVWSRRRDRVAELIEQNADVAGLQEALVGQVDDLSSRLKEFAWYGVGREDGKRRGEFTPIFYRKQRFEPVSRGVFWLSKNPEQPGSKGWDAAITRHCTWMKLKDKRTGVTWAVFNTHFDHRGRNARRESAKLMIKKIATIAGESPVVLVGDFNTKPDSAPYRILTAKVDSAAEGPSLADAKSTTTTAHVGPDSTWNGFVAIVPGRRIDFVFVRRGRVVVTSHRILSAKIGDRFASDHLPVVATVRNAEKQSDERP